MSFHLKDLFVCMQVDRFPISLPDAIITSDCIVHGFNGIIVPLSIPVDAGLVPTTPPVFGGPLPPGNSAFQSPDAYCAASSIPVFVCSLVELRLLSKKVNFGSSL